MSASATTSTPTTSSFSNLFPTNSASATGSSSDEDDGKSKSNTNVYYLVFLGVLVVLMLIALCLAVRAMRMRRRYRAAAQAALARGETVPGSIRDDFWGMGGLAGWNSDGWDRFGAVGPGGLWKDSKWHKLPVLTEAEAAQESEKADYEATDLWTGDTRPLSLQSRKFLPEESPMDALAGLQPRNVRARNRHPALFNRSRPTDALDRSNPFESKQNIPEIDRSIGTGEPLRIGVVIQMPNPVISGQRYTQGDDDEQVAWESGMEIGLWEGVVEGKLARDSSADLASASVPVRREDGGGLARNRSEDSYGNADIALYR
ncbi:hypothetical protein B9479_004057 [Cryptococcus floricola]|uniref:Uncharacterized protein n=1 Tax=Cryptococcus floricola TaxID=2591691 RepID=A0A5D3AUS3_9TREE|nr:hypothetical protein B9479_004057 [Cryptococcus floricola]